MDLVTTDGFLHPTKELVRRNIMHRKGFPESYDRRKLLRFVTEVKSGAKEVAAPIYSHISYDIIPGQYHIVRQPDILIIEGLNVLQTGPRLMVSDLFDFSIYVDARIEDIEKWYVERFLALRKTSFADPEAHFHHYANLSDRDAMSAAKEIWHSINLPNLVENILPTRPRAPWSCARTRITPSTGSGCASSDAARRPALPQAPNRRCRQARTGGAVRRSRAARAGSRPGGTRASTLGEPDLRVGGLPEQESGQSLLTGGTDHEVRIGLTGGVEVTVDAVDRHRLDELLATQPLRVAHPQKRLHRVDDLLATAVPDGHVDVRARPARSAGAASCSRLAWSAGSRSVVPTIFTPQFWPGAEISSTTSEMISSSASSSSGSRRRFSVDSR